jgi:bifunctional non-homologous end joining protein LigD
VHVRADLIPPELRLTSLDRVLWPNRAFTKGDLLEYYARVAPALLPHLAGRPLTLGRFPSGVHGRGFAQLECRGSPPWVQTAPIALRDGRVRNLCLAQDLPSLLWIANQGTIELHVFLSALPELDQPKAVLFDLDPEPPATAADAARVALTLRDRLATQGLSSLVKTTGGLGLHVLVPLNQAHAYDQTRAFARAIARELAERDPQRIASSAAGRRQRAGRVLIDWAQNNARRTLIAPYSLRAAEEPLVSTPIAWEEVERGRLRFGPAEVLERIERLGELWSQALHLEQRL